MCVCVCARARHAQMQPQIFPVYDFETAGVIAGDELREGRLVVIATNIHKPELTWVSFGLLTTSPAVAHHLSIFPIPSPITHITVDLDTAERIDVLMLINFSSGTISVSRRGWQYDNPQRFFQCSLQCMQYAYTRVLEIYQSLWY